MVWYYCRDVCRALAPFVRSVNRTVSIIVLLLEPEQNYRRVLCKPISTVQTSQQTYLWCLVV
jgi:hypothetical protein